MSERQRRISLSLRRRRAAAALAAWIAARGGVAAATPSLPRAAPASWVVAPSPRSRGASSSRGRRAAASGAWNPLPPPSSPSSLDMAVQDRILEGLGIRRGGGGGRRDDDEADVDVVAGGTAPSPPATPRVPFVIQRIGRGTKREIEEITRMCIDVFFNERRGDGDVGDAAVDGGVTGSTTPWKAAQLAYLRNFQRGDILARNAFRKDQLVDLVVARRVYAATDNASRVGEKWKRIEDGIQIFNLDDMPEPSNGSSGGGGYVAGEIIGYCEVSEKNFGLGGNFGAAGDGPGQRKNGKSGEKPRPYLSNLSVVPPARRSGVGSALLDACVDAVQSWDAGHAEVVLQVEEDNPDAVRFYERRGWEFVFADPTCRRYDTSGFFLRELRVTKYAMVKRLVDERDNETNGKAGDDGGAINEAGSSSFMQKLKNSFFVQS